MLILGLTEPANQKRWVNNLIVLNLVGTWKEEKKRVQKDIGTKRDTYVSCRVTPDLEAIFTDKKKQTRTDEASMLEIPPFSQ